MDKKTAIKLAATLKGQQVGGWQVGEYLNCGKSAFVCEASKNGVTAAIKIYDSILTEEFGEEVQTKRIKRQLVLVGKEHPNLVRIYDGGQCKEHGLFFLVMERVNKKSLDKAIPSFPRDKIATIINQIASATKFLEELGAAHRDIKPSNIAITEDLKQATLLDLGVIRPLTDDNITDATKKKAFIGTLRYSPPEFLLRQEKDSVEGWRAITFYQLGAVLHDMIMRYPLFQDESEPYARLVCAVCDQTPMIQADDVPTELVQLAKICLLKEPEKRLKYLNWDDFWFPKPEINDVEAAKARIQKRRKFALAQVQKKIMIWHEQRKAKQFLYDLAQCVRDAARNTCIGSDNFPPIKLEEHCDIGGLVYALTVNMEPSEVYALKTHLKIYVNAEILDLQAGLLRIEGSALLANDSMVSKKPDVTTNFFEGVFDSKTISASIDRLIHIFIDEAQRRCEKIQNEELNKNNRFHEWILPNLINKKEHK